MLPILVSAAIAAGPEDHLPAYQLSNGTTIITLLKGQFECPEGERRAVLVHQSGASWIGCWTRNGMKLVITLEDGTPIEVPIKEKDMPQ